MEIKKIENSRKEETTHNECVSGWMTECTNESEIESNKNE